MKKFKVTYFRIPLKEDGTLEHPIYFEEGEVDAVDMKEALEIAITKLGSVVGIVELGYE